MRMAGCSQCHWTRWRETRKSSGTWILSSRAAHVIWKCLCGPWWRPLFPTATGLRLLKITPESPPATGWITTQLSAQPRREPRCWNDCADWERTGACSRDTQGGPDEAGHTKFPQVLSQWDALPIPLGRSLPASSWWTSPAPPKQSGMAPQRQHRDHKASLHNPPSSPLDL